MDTDKIEILSVDLLEQHRDLVDELIRLANDLGLGLGWHYLLDLSWTISNLDLSPKYTLMDAGAGYGVLQWWLSNHGSQVISVDVTSRKYLPERFCWAYPITGIRPNDFIPPYNRDIRKWNRTLSSYNPLKWVIYLKRLVQTQPKWQAWVARRRKGKIFIYNQDLTTMSEIPDNSIDIVVSISALEHNSPGKLLECVAELKRVLKPGGKLIATLGAAKDQDWFHEPSKGWCYTSQSLKHHFGMIPSTPDNYQSYDILFEKLKNCEFLKTNLAGFYSKSGDNGMPWGVWDPKYQSVGIVKIKPKE